MHLGGIHLSGLGADSLRQADSPAPSSGTQGAPDSISFSKALEAQKPTPTARPPRTLVAATRTELTSEQASAALRDAWQSHFGEAPREETVAVLTAQWSHETGNGRSMYNFNFGGIKGTGPSGLTVSQRTKEGWGAHETTIRDNFRAYKSAEEGASDYLSLLRRRYSGALEAAQQGDPAGFVRGLKKGGYFTGNEGAYIRSVSQRTAQLLGHEPAQNQSSLPQGVLPLEQKRNLNVAPRPAAQASLAPQTQPHPASAGVRLDELSLNTLPGLEPPTAGALSAFDDALSRAALRIALDAPSHLRNDKREDRS